MSDDRTGRELTPRPDDASVTPTGGAVTPVQVAQVGVDRFSAGEQAHTVGLTEERAAQVVRQSGNARNVAFLAVLIVSLFIPVYWFYEIGIPALGAKGRLTAEEKVQYVTDVSRGYALYLANCARCHGPDGKGGIGPPLNDQAKLAGALTPAGLPGKGHLNPVYLDNVLTVGGRYVCGDPNSVMPIWKQPGGPLTYKQVEEIIKWLTAGSDVSFTYTPPVSEVGGDEPAPTAVVVHGWRDPNYKPPPGAPTPPACWRNPSGIVGGGGGAPAASAAPITSPGTADDPRVIQLVETAQVTITDASGTPITSIPVKAGEVVEFDVENKAGFEHNFYIGAPADLQAADASKLQGVPAFTSGVQKVKVTVPQDGQLGFACTLPGHYQTMHGDLAVQK